MGRTKLQLEVPQGCPVRDKLLRIQVNPLLPEIKLVSPLLPVSPEWVQSQGRLQDSHNSKDLLEEIQLG